MAIIDSQVHAYEANSPKRPWHTVPNWPDHVTGDEMVAAMDKVGVDGAIFISAFSLYRYDSSYAVEVQRAHPGRLAIVKPLDPDDPGVAEVVAEWKKTPGAVGIRVMLRKEEKRAGGRSRPRPDCARGRSLRFSAQHPVLGQSGRRHGADRSPSRHAVHHRPSRHPAAARAAGAAEPWADLPKVLELAKRPNCRDQGQRRLHAVARAVSFPDIWDPLARVFDAWGFDRCLWGTDWTRAFAVVNYEQAVEPFLKTSRLSDSERAMLMGGACSKAYGWSPKKG